MHLTQFKGTAIRLDRQVTGEQRQAIYIKQLFYIYNLLFKLIMPHLQSIDLISQHKHYHSVFNLLVCGGLKLIVQKEQSLNKINKAKSIDIF